MVDLGTTVDLVLAFLGSGVWTNVFLLILVVDATTKWNLGAI